MQLSDGFLHKHEVVMNAAMLYESSLARGNQTVQLRPKSICKDLRYDFREVVDKTDWYEVCNSLRAALFRH
jgi:hypothetical protein